jgi:catechol 2,3-dioxygenase-like lactoylglutathione lyase family enzyme
MLTDAMSYATIPASDLQRARRWYEEKLGLKASREETDGLIYETGKGTGFLLYPSQFAGTNQATSLGFQVSDFDGEMAELRRRGVVFEEYDMGDIKTENGVVTMPNGSRGCWFKDSEGNILALDDTA